jgi:hypothetical protein
MKQCSTILLKLVRPELLASLGEALPQLRENPTLADSPVN